MSILPFVLGIVLEMIGVFTLYMLILLCREIMDDNTSKATNNNNSLTHSEVVIDRVDNTVYIRE